MTDTTRELARIADALEAISGTMTYLGMTLDNLDNRDSVWRKS